jgi:drug/metabolite transporter (DMT)-like permease
MASDKMAWIILFAGFMASTVSQLLIKARMDPVTAAGGSYRSLMTDPLIWVAVLCIIAFVVCWYTALASLQLSLMMAWSAIVLPLIAIGGWMFLGEPLGTGKIVSIIIISIGVACLSIF